MIVSQANSKNSMNSGTTQITIKPNKLPWTKEIKLLTAHETMATYVLEQYFGTKLGIYFQYLEHYWDLKLQQRHVSRKVIKHVAVRQKA